MSRKGQKNLRGQPEIWGELKKPVTMTLTPTSVSGLDTIAHGLGISRSELVERVGRGVIPIHLETLDGSAGAI